MEKTTISRLKAHLSAYLKKVRAGRTILILDRDEPVARLERVTPAPGAGDRDSDRLTRLERRGQLRRARRTVPIKELRRPAPRSRTSVVDAVLDDRRSGR